MSSKAEPLPKRLVMSVLVLTIVVLALGGAVVALKLKPARTPTGAIDRNVAMWEEAVIANPQDDSARVGLGIALLDAGRSGEARSAFHEALDLNKHNWSALFQLGLLARQDDPEGALDLLSRAAENAPQGSRAVPLVAMGDLLMQQDDPKRAAAAYQEASADAPYLFDAHFGLATALEAMGDKKAALAEYEAAASFDPTNQAVADAIARLKGKG
jgi:tetratricopeptide (TPR) repeat protein